MINDVDKNRMSELVSQLNEYAYRYYVLDDPSVADNVYDKLYDELLLLEKQTGTVLPDSPTKRVGGEPIKEFVPHTHINRLYSLDKCQSVESLIAWDEKIKKAVGKIVYTLEYKLDGLTVVITYKNGVLFCASTRGNGVTGEDVTAQVMTIKSVPSSIPYKGTVEVKGECIMRRSAFKKYNESAIEPLKNPRNAAAGALRNLDPRVTASRNLDIIFYDVNYIQDNSVSSQKNGIKWLKNNRFKTETLSTTSDINDIIKSIQTVNRDALDFDIDGMVVKVDSYDYRIGLGFTDKFPRWAIAYKFEAEETTTVVEDIQWQVGRTGKVTPIALVSPVELCGATVRRATLNNYADICRKKVNIGSTVFIRRSNDVIPEILSAVDGDENIVVVKPTVCPACGSILTENGAHLFCNNFDGCRPQIIARLTHFVSKPCMDIDGLSEKTLAQFYDVFGLKYVYELYYLSRDKLRGLDSFKDKKADNIINAINSSKHVALSAFINALGIPNVGKKLAYDLAEVYKSIDSLAAATQTELASIDDIGDIVASGIVDYFRERSHIYKKLIEKGVEPVFAQKSEGGTFSGKKVVLTGTLEHYSRSDAGKIIESMGGIILSSVTKDTDLLIVGANAGSKLEKARKAGITVIDENEFISMINT